MLSTTSLPVVTSTLDQQGFMSNGTLPLPLNKQNDIQDIDIIKNYKLTIWVLAVSLFTHGFFQKLFFGFRFCSLNFKISYGKVFQRTKISVEILYTNFRQPSL